MLNREIKKWDLVLAMINAVIGAGIFGLPSKIFAQSGVFSLFSFVLCAGIIMIFIFCFAEVSSRFDKTGGPYVYVQTAFGPFAGFLTGWIVFLARIFAYATLINLMVTYLSFFTDAFNGNAVRIMTIAVVTALLTYANHIGVKNSTRVNNFLAVAKLLPLSIFIIVGLFFIQPSLFEIKHTPTLYAFSNTSLVLVFAFVGFEAVLINSGEIVNPSKNLPFALITSMIIIVIYYWLIQVVSIGTLPTLAESSKPMADAASQFMGRNGGVLMAIGAAVSILGTLNVIMLTGSRMPFAFSSEKQFPEFFSFIHPRYKTPTWSLLLMMALSAVVSVAWTFMTALTISTIFRILTYLLVCASLIRLRKLYPNSTGLYKIKNGVFLAIAGILFSVWLLSASKLSEITDTAICIGIGLLLYFIQKYFWKRK